MVTGNIKVAAKRSGGVHVSFPVPWPARVNGVGGIKVTKQNGVWVVQPDFGSLADVVPPAPKWPTSTFWYFDAVSEMYFQLSIQELVGMIGGSGGGGAAPRVVTAAGAVNITNNDTVVILNKAAPSVTPVSLPAVAARNPAGLDLTIVDYAGNGGDITITPSGAEKIMGVSPWIVGSGGVAGSGGTITLSSNTDVGGWIIK